MNTPSLLANKYPFLISLPHFVQTILDFSIKFTKKAALKIHIRKISTASLRLSYKYREHSSLNNFAVRQECASSLWLSFAYYITPLFQKQLYYNYSYFIITNKL